MTSTILPTISDKEIRIVHIFDAPRDLVWAAWSNPEHLKNWWGPNGFTNSIDEFDFRSGGSWHSVMHGPNGMDFKYHNLFVEIKKPELIIMDHLSDPKFRITATFEEVGQKTKMTFAQVFETRETFEQVKSYAVPGSQQTIEKLVQYLAMMEK